MNKIPNERIGEIAYTMTIILVAVAAAVLLFLLFIPIRSWIGRKFFNKKVDKIAYLIKSIGKNDFNIVTENKKGEVAISQDNGICYFAKTLELSGDTKIGMKIPNHSLILKNSDDEADNFYTGMPTEIWISEQQYKDYLDLIKDCDRVSTNSYFLKIELKNTDIISLLKECRLIVYIEYQFERYDVLNLVTNMQPFSKEEIDSIIDKIKDRMIERLNFAIGE